jgi:tRNA-splicing ligase RtcB (3'-phosphate/5'-hydroxy nucleic acid ligase)
VLTVKIVEERRCRHRIRQEAQMRLPGVVFVSRELLPDVRADKSLEQVANVATLPGIVEASYAMPDLHWGTGFPSAEWRPPTLMQAESYHGRRRLRHSCGVRLLAAGLDRDRLTPYLVTIMNRLGQMMIRRGMGGGCDCTDRQSWNRYFSAGMLG